MTAFYMNTKANPDVCDVHVEHGDLKFLPGTHFRINSLECCGWFNISSFGHGKPSDFEWISTQLKIKCPFIGSRTNSEPASFTLFAVLTEQQLNFGEWTDLFDKFGWEHVCEFYNPNTGNICHQYVKRVTEEGQDFATKSVEPAS